MTNDELTRVAEDRGFLLVQLIADAAFAEPHSEEEQRTKKAMAMIINDSIEDGSIAGTVTVIAALAAGMARKLADATGEEPDRVLAWARSRWHAADAISDAEQVVRQAFEDGESPAR
jgi:hypothetical protein